MKMYALVSLFLGGLFVLGACAGASKSSPNGGTQTTSTTATDTSSTSTASSTATASTTNTSTVTSSTTSTTTSTSTTNDLSLPPPNPCSNQFSTNGCRKGVASSTCGGLCANDYGPTAGNACESGKQGLPVNYICPRFVLFSDEMKQAASADGSGNAFNYAIVGHDMDNGGVDPSNTTSSCCHCYQLVFTAGQTDSVASDIPLPKPMIVQSFNTSAGGGKNFDIFMGAGGFGANNACAAVNGVSLTNPANPPQYTSFPPQGETCCGGVSVINSFQTNCKSNGKVTQATLSSTACQTEMSAACNLATGTTAAVTNETRTSCIQSNQVASFYHQNFSAVYAMGVECPTSLTDVTGCKLANLGLPAPDPTANASNVASKPGFKPGYTTTTMQDCCMPTCAWSNNTTGAGTPVGGYNSFYSCDVNGVPWTTAVTRTQ